MVQRWRGSYFVWILKLIDIGNLVDASIGRKRWLRDNLLCGLKSNSWFWICWKACLPSSHRPRLPVQFVWRPQLGARIRLWLVHDELVPKRVHWIVRIAAGLPTEPNSSLLQKHFYQHHWRLVWFHQMQHELLDRHIDRRRQHKRPQDLSPNEKYW